ncbi:XRE family transcriptional regulator [Devosia sp.]|uniref:XRE family transcriptional regulator n=1 Tax=Devosia sp. TaxID=1871048 RepID=UPI0025D42D01|nr:XRE family transcriptional regulator [Devosia sp.]MCR6637107.1 XRE family transcriptional regulator [Devosia sp.]
MANRPFEKSNLASFLQARIVELQPVKTQADIASEAGFRNASMLALIKNGTTRLPLDRVPALAVALEIDSRRLMFLAMQQTADDTTMRAFREIFGTPVTTNELAWLEEIRSASGGSDPWLTSRSRVALRAIFGK